MVDVRSFAGIRQDDQTRIIASAVFRSSTLWSRRTLLMASVSAITSAGAATTSSLPPQPVEIQLPSVMSLFLKPRVRGRTIATATGFAVQGKNGPLLVTNRHVVTNRATDPDGRMLSSDGAPDELVILHNRKDRLGSWIEKVEPLLAGGHPTWFEHPTLKGQADAVALPLTDLEDVQIYPYRLDDPLGIMVGPADVVSVIGYPFGIAAQGLAVWDTGFVASELGVDFSGLPVFLIDCRSRPGQSGSPVIAYRNGGSVHTSNALIQAIPGPVYRVLGVYSGRINAQSDLGLVWRTAFVRELLAAAE